VGGAAAGARVGIGYGALIVVLRGLRTVDALVVTTMNTLGSGLILLAATLLWGMLALTAAQWGVLATMAVVQFTLPYVLFAMALRYVDATRAASITLLEMVLNPIWTFFIIGEVPPAATLVGGPLVLAAVGGSMMTKRGTS
jgi:drug/metabolite transporter (DMT)-like permease